MERLYLTGMHGALAQVRCHTGGVAEHLQWVENRPKLTASGTVECGHSVPE
jgi:hypothetical protein